MEDQIVEPVPSSTDDDDDVTETSDEELIDSIIDQAPGPKRIPFIDDLPDAVIDGAFTLGVGDTVIIERWFMTGEKRHWIGTGTYVIQRISENGDLTLSDVVTLSAAMANWRSGTDRGWRFKVPQRAGSRRAVVKRRRRASR